MAEIDGFPLPATAYHDRDGNHVPPHIPEWRRAAGTMRTPLGREIERDQRQKELFAAHLAEHRRRGEPDIVIG